MAHTTGKHLWTVTGSIAVSCVVLAGCGDAQPQARIVESDMVVREFRPVPAGTTAPVTSTPLPQPSRSPGDGPSVSPDAPVVDPSGSSVSPNVPVTTPSGPSATTDQPTPDQPTQDPPPEATAAPEDSPTVVTPVTRVSVISVVTPVTAITVVTPRTAPSAS